MNNLIKPKTWGGLCERKEVSNCKKMHVHPDTIGTMTNFITSAFKTKTEFDIKVEAKTEVKVMVSKVKKREDKRHGIVERT